MAISFKALATDEVRKLQKGGLDINGQRPEVAISDGGGNPCRHCLQDIPAGEEMLIVAFRPFPAPHPDDRCQPWQNRPQARMPATGPSCFFGA